MRARKHAQAQHDGKTAAVLLAAGAFGLSGLLRTDARANSHHGRHHFIATFSSGNAAIAINGGGGGATVVALRRGTVSLTSHDGWCVPSTTPPRPCRYTLNSLELELGDFEIADVKVEGLRVSSWAPTPSLVSMSDIHVIPEGTAFNATARIDGEVSAFPVRANAILSLDPGKDLLGLLGSFRTRFEDRDIDVAVFGAVADVPFANHPPRANAGPDQSHETECVAQVRLDPSGTTDQDGNYSHAFFTEHGVPIGSHAAPVPFLPGRHVLTLDARDARGARDTARVTIDVRATETTTPVPGATPFAVEVPAGTKPESIALLSRSEMSLGPNSSVETAGGDGVIVNLGMGTATLGVGTHVKDVWSRGPLVVHTDGVVDGTVRARSTIALKNRAVVRGTIDSQAVFDPLRRVSWNAVLGSASLGDVSISPKGASALAPGRYGRVLVQPKATLRIQPGVYAADELRIQPGARVEVDPPGPLVFYVLSSMGYDGPSLGSNPDSFLLAYDGSEPLFLNEPFAGTVLAPNARLVLAKVDGRHTGAWFAGSIEVRPGVVVEHRPFGWNLFAETRSACVITPTVTCIARSPGGTFARFGYKNLLTYSGVSVALGAFNRFAPGPESRGQPSAFRPGTHDGAFEVPFDGSPLTWIVGARSATATSESPACP